MSMTLFFYSSLSSFDVQNVWIMKKIMTANKAKAIEETDTDCDNPISLDEIENGLWLGSFN